jgi:hypothetical protein
MNDSRLLSFIPKGYVDVTKETSLRPCFGYNKRKPFALSIALCAYLGGMSPPNKRMTKNQGKTTAPFLHDQLTISYLAAPVLGSRYTFPVAPPRR